MPVLLGHDGLKSGIKIAVVQPGRHMALSAYQTMQVMKLGERRNVDKAAVSMRDIVTGYEPCAAELCR